MLLLCSQVFWLLMTLYVNMTTGFQPVSPTLRNTIPCCDGREPEEDVADKIAAFNGQWSNEVAEKCMCQCIPIDNQER